MENLVDKIRDAGIVGAGGAGFPSHIKFNASAEYVLVNGAECEPLLRVDQQLMRDYGLEMLEGLDACVKSVGAKEGIIGLKGKYKEAIKVLTALLPKFPALRLHELDNVYPAGDEQYLVYELTGRIVPEGGIPLNVATIVTNVETLINVQKALSGRPVTSKFVTIAGAVRNPMTVEVPVGTPLEWLIEKAGGALTPCYKVIDGGPMMGKVIDAAGTYVKKTSKGYIILPEDHPLIMNKEKDLQKIMKEAKTSCCHCDLCTDVCPRYLLGHDLHPAKLMRIASYQSLGDKKASLDEAYLCCECGLCEQVCIMNLQPWKLNSHLKKELSKQQIPNSHKREIEKVNLFREYRGFPVSKLVPRLKLSMYDVAAPLIPIDLAVDTYRIYGGQHIGKPGELAVSVGDDVTAGDIVFRAAENGLSASVHASVDGKVTVANGEYVEIKK